MTRPRANDSENAFPNRADGWVFSLQRKQFLQNKRNLLTHGVADETRINSRQWNALTPGSVLWGRRICAALP